MQPGDDFLGAPALIVRSVDLGPAAHNCLDFPLDRVAIGPGLEEDIESVHLGRVFEVPSGGGGGPGHGLCPFGWCRADHLRCLADLHADEVGTQRSERRIRLELDHAHRHAFDVTPGVAKQQRLARLRLPLPLLVNRLGDHH